MSDDERPGTSPSDAENQGPETQEAPGTDPVQPADAPEAVRKDAFIPGQDGERQRHEGDDPDEHREQVDGVGPAAARPPHRPAGAGEEDAAPSRTSNPKATSPDTSTGAAEPAAGPAMTAGEEAAAAVPAAPTGRAALFSALWPPRVTRGQLVVGALLFVLGIGLAVQMRAAGEDDALRGARPEDLVRSLSDLDERNKRLDEERDELERQRTELENSSDQADEARRQNEERELQLGVLAGTVAATGPGIEIAIDDPAAAVGADQLLDAVQELRAAGAEALQINDVRVVASTAFVDEEGGGVLIDGEPVGRPYRAEVIGSPEDLEPALNIPGGVVQSLENEGAEISVERPDEVTVNALRTAEPPDYAQSSS